MSLTFGEWVIEKLLELPMQKRSFQWRTKWNIIAAGRRWKKMAFLSSIAKIGKVSKKIDFIFSWIEEVVETEILLFFFGGKKWFLSFFLFVFLVKTVNGKITNEFYQLWRRKRLFQRSFEMAFCGFSVFCVNKISTKIWFLWKYYKM